MNNLIPMSYCLTKENILNSFNSILEQFNFQYETTISEQIANYLLIKLNYLRVWNSRYIEGEESQFNFAFQNIIIKYGMTIIQMFQLINSIENNILGDTEQEILKVGYDGFDIDNQDGSFNTTVDTKTKNNVIENLKHLNKNLFSLGDDIEREIEANLVMWGGF